jgi:hypothetical protein
MKTKQKGNRTERLICETLNKRFHYLIERLGGFSRSVGSGNRWGQNVPLSKQAAEVYGGDITPPERFLWSLESKGGYGQLDLGKIVEGPIKLLDDFLKQTLEDSIRTGRRPALIIKQDRKKPVVFVISKEEKDYENCLKYGDWLGISLEQWLTNVDDYFFDV